MEKFLSEAIWSWTFLGREFFKIIIITDSISLLVISLFRSSVLPDLVLVGCLFFGDLSISSRLSNLLAYNCSQYSFTIFHSISCFSSLIFLFVYFDHLSFLLGKPGQKFDLVYGFKEVGLGFIDFFLLFNLYFIYFLSDLCYFLFCVTVFLKYMSYFLFWTLISLRAGFLLDYFLDTQQH